MAIRLLRLALRHRGVVTATVLAALLVNLVVIGATETPDRSVTAPSPSRPSATAAVPGAPNSP